MTKRNKRAVKKSAGITRKQRTGSFSMIELPSGINRVYKNWRKNQLTRYVHRLIRSIHLIDMEM